MKLVCIGVLATLAMGSTSMARGSSETLKVYCLFQAQGADRLTQKAFLLKDYASQTLFVDGNRRYEGIFTTNADANEKGLSAVEIAVSDSSINARYSARTTFKKSVGFSQVRLDVKPADAEKNGPDVFLLCTDKAE